MEDLARLIGLAYLAMRNGMSLDENADELKRVFLARLDDGSIRAAEPGENGCWRVNSWVQQGILFLFRSEPNLHHDGGFYDKRLLKTKQISFERDNIRLVPGGSSIRSGCFIGTGVVVMPPAYVNIGAYVDAGTMIDSHALIGSCAQVGKRVHISAGCMIGGVLEPIGARPVIIEDEVMLGGQSGVYEGVVVRSRAVLSSGVILNGSSKVYDLVRRTIYENGANGPLEIPAGAVVVPGTRHIGRFAEHGDDLALATPIIVKYRDDKTEKKVGINEDLR